MQKYQILSKDDAKIASCVERWYKNCQFCRKMVQKSPISSDWCKNCFLKGWHKKLTISSQDHKKISPILSKVLRKYSWITKKI